MGNVISVIWKIIFYSVVFMALAGRVVRSAPVVRAAQPGESNDSTGEVGHLIANIAWSNSPEELASVPWISDSDQDSNESESEEGNSSSKASSDADAGPAMANDERNVAELLKKYRQAFEDGIAQLRQENNFASIEYRDIEDLLYQNLRNKLSQESSNTDQRKDEGIEFREEFLRGSALEEERKNLQKKHENKTKKWESEAREQLETFKVESADTTIHPAALQLKIVKSTIKMKAILNASAEEKKLEVAHFNQKVEIENSRKQIRKNLAVQYLGDSDYERYQSALSELTKKLDLAEKENDRFLKEGREKIRQKREIDLLVLPAPHPILSGKKAFPDPEAMTLLGNTQDLNVCVRYLESPRSSEDYEKIYEKYLEQTQKIIDRVMKLPVVNRKWVELEEWSVAVGNALDYSDRTDFLTVIVNPLHRKHGATQIRPRSTAGDEIYAAPHAVESRRGSSMAISPISFEIKRLEKALPKQNSMAKFLATREIPYVILDPARVKMPNPILEGLSYQKAMELLNEQLRFHAGLDYNLLMGESSLVQYLIYLEPPQSSEDYLKITEYLLSEIKKVISSETPEKSEKLDTLIKYVFNSVPANGRNILQKEIDQYNLSYRKTKYMREEYQFAHLARNFTVQKGHDSHHSYGNEGFVRAVEDLYVIIDKATPLMPHPISTGDSCLLKGAEIFGTRSRFHDAYTTSEGALLVLHWEWPFVEKDYPRVKEYFLRELTQLSSTINQHNELDDLANCLVYSVPLEWRQRLIKDVVTPVYLRVSKNKFMYAMINNENDKETTDLPHFSRLFGSDKYEEVFYDDQSPVEDNSWQLNWLAVGALIFVGGLAAVSYYVQHRRTQQQQNILRSEESVRSRRRRARDVLLPPPSSLSPTLVASVEPSPLSEEEKKAKEEKAEKEKKELKLREIKSADAGEINAGINAIFNTLKNTVDDFKRIAIKIIHNGDFEQETCLQRSIGKQIDNYVQMQKSDECDSFERKRHEACESFKKHFIARFKEELESRLSVYSKEKSKQEAITEMLEKCKAEDKSKALEKTSTRLTRAGENIAAPVRLVAATPATPKSANTPSPRLSRMPKAQAAVDVLPGAEGLAGVRISGSDSDSSSSPRAPRGSAGYFPAQSQPQSQDERLFVDRRIAELRREYDEAFDHPPEIEKDLLEKLPEFQQLCLRSVAPVTARDRMLGLTRMLYAFYHLLRFLDWNRDTTSALVHSFVHQFNQYLLGKSTDNQIEDFFQRFWNKIENFDKTSILRSLNELKSDPSTFLAEMKNLSAVSRQIGAQTPVEDYVHVLLVGIKLLQTLAPLNEENKYDYLALGVLIGDVWMEAKKKPGHDTVLEKYLDVEMPTRRIPRRGKKPTNKLSEMMEILNEFSGKLRWDALHDPESLVEFPSKLLKDLLNTYEDAMKERAELEYYLKQIENPRRAAPSVPHPTRQLKRDRDESEMAGPAPARLV